MTAAVSRSLLVAGALLITIGCRDSLAPPSPAPADPLEGEIVFVGLEDGNRSLYRVQLDGEQLTKLTDDMNDKRQPTVQGSKVIYVGYANGTADLYQLSLLDPLPVQTPTLLTTTTPAHETAPRLSRDGRRLLYLSDVTGVTRLWIADADGGNARSLVQSSQGAPLGGNSPEIHTLSSWSPSGDSVVFTSTALGNAELFVVRPTDGDAIALSVGAPPNVDPAWSPDGKQIVFVSSRDGTPSLYLFTFSTGTTRRLTTAPVAHGEPTWTRHGYIVFTTYGQNSAPSLRWINPLNPTQTDSIPIPFRASQSAGVL